jgi:hypothetical protein
LPAADLGAPLDGLAIDQTGRKGLSLDPLETRLPEWFPSSSTLRVAIVLEEKAKNPLPLSRRSQLRTVMFSPNST